MELKNLILAMAIATPFGLTGCDSNDGPAEEAGENVDDAVDRAGDRIEDAGDKMEDKMDR
jgi:hypothetical protein